MKKIIAALLSFAFLLAGCLTVISTESVLKISGGEKWKFHMELAAPQEQVAIYSSDLAQQFNAIAENSASKGIDFTWKQGNVDDDGNAIFLIDVSGTGFELWNEWIEYSGSLQKVEFLGEPVVKFSLNMGYTAIGQGLSNSFTLEGGKILSTNGTQINATTVKWVDVGEMEAIMSSPSVLPVFLIIGIVAGILVILVVLILVFTKSKKPKSAQLKYSNYQRSNTGKAYGSVSSNQTVSSSYPQQSLSNRNNPPQNAGSQVCAHCGEPRMPGGKFCTKCGRSF